VGQRVTPTWITLRECHSMMKNAKSERKKRSVTGRRVAGPDLFRMSVQESGPVLSFSSRCANSSYVLLNCPLADVNAHLEHFTTDALRSPEAILRCHLLDHRSCLLRDFRLRRTCSGCVLPEEPESLAVPPQERLWLDNERRVFPGLNHACEKHQEDPICPGACWSFHLSAEANQLLAQEGVFCHECGLRSGQVSHRSHEKRGVSWFGPVDEMLLEQLKALACQSLNAGDDTLHSYDSFYKDEQVHAVRFYSPSAESARAIDVGKCSQRPH
jgi:hypothetical protein